MLHALLHRKLDETIPEPQRLEDALTSTVFGLLVCVGAWEVLGAWLGVAALDRDGRLGGSATECWFWPRLAFAEPDVVLRIGDVLVVVEAKHRAGLHHLTDQEGQVEDAGDQLVRQHQSIAMSPEHRRRYAEPIERAILECRLVQVLVVDARRLRRARREYEESRRRLPADAVLRLITWQNLFRHLSDYWLSGERWATDLRAYLERCGLDSFEGVGRRLPVSAGLGCVSEWRAPVAALGLRDALSGLPAERQLAELRRWSPVIGSAVWRDWSELVHPRVIDGTASDALLEWCRLAVDNRASTVGHRRRRGIGP